MTAAAHACSSPPPIAGTRSCASCSPSTATSRSKSDLEELRAERFEYKVIDTGRHIEEQLNELGSQGWQVVGVTTKKQLLIAPPQAIIVMREVEPAAAPAPAPDLAHA